jgi:hypothetical protein
MPSLSHFLTRAIFRLPFLSMPAFLADVVSECPSREELRSGTIFIEIRGGYPKWAHLRCPKCGDHIQLPLAGTDRWTVRVDFLHRPTLSPSVWEERACGAHFIVRKGNLYWCR